MQDLCLKSKGSADVSYICILCNGQQEAVLLAPKQSEVLEVYEKAMLLFPLFIISVSIFLSSV